VVVRGLSIELTPEIIGKITTPPLGVPWRKEDIGHMEEKIKEMGKEMSSLRDIEAIMKAQLQAQNAWLKGKL